MVCWGSKGRQKLTCAQGLGSDRIVGESARVESKHGNEDVRTREKLIKKLNEWKESGRCKM